MTIFNSNDLNVIIIYGATCYLSDATMRQYRNDCEEIEAERRQAEEEKRIDWIMWHVFARRWMLYDSQEDYDMFSDWYKDLHGIRPRWVTKEYVRHILDSKNERRPRSIFSF